jgi:hypothetical protein
MKKLILALLLTALAVLIVVRPSQPKQTKEASPKTPVTVSAEKKWVELEDGSKNGTKISLDVTSFEVITPADVFEFIIMFEYSQPKLIDEELVIATVSSIQISCKQKVVAMVRDLSINEQQQNVKPNSMSKEIGVNPLIEGSHFGDIAQFICTRGGTYDPSTGEERQEPAPQRGRDRQQAERGT